MQLLCVEPQRASAAHCCCCWIIFNFPFALFSIYLSIYSILCNAGFIITHLLFFCGSLQKTSRFKPPGKPNVLLLAVSEGWAYCLRLANQRGRRDRQWYGCPCNVTNTHTFQQQKKGSSRKSKCWNSFHVWIIHWQGFRQHCLCVIWQLSVVPFVGVWKLLKQTGGWNLLFNTVQLSAIML